MLVFFQANAISLLVKTVEKLIILKDLIILGANVFLGVRKTISFSKKIENPIGAIWYFIHQYNYVLSE
jgi:hypothetical protein